MQRAPARSCCTVFVQPCIPLYSPASYRQVAVSFSSALHARCPAPDPLKVSCRLTCSIQPQLTAVSAANPHSYPALRCTLPCSAGFYWASGLPSLVWVLHPLVSVRLVNNYGRGWCGDLTLISMWHARRGGPFAHHGALNLWWHPSPGACAIELRRQARNPRLLAQYLAEHNSDADQVQGALASLRQVLTWDGSEDWSPM